MKGVLSVSVRSFDGTGTGAAGRNGLGRPSAVWTASPWRNLVAPSTDPVEL